MKIMTQKSLDKPKNEEIKSQVLKVEEVTDKPKNEREEFDRLLTGLECGGVIILEDEMWYWHLESQKRLLERVRDDVLDHYNCGEKGCAICTISNYQHSKLQSLIKEVEGEK